MTGKSLSEGLVLIGRSLKDLTYVNGDTSVSTEAKQALAAIQQAVAEGKIKDIEITDGKTKEGAKGTPELG